MKIKTRSAIPCLAWILALLLVTACSDDSSDAGTVAAPEPELADLILTGARVYTVNPEQPWAEAVAIRQDRILGVGSETAMQKFKGAQTRLMAFPDGMILPGFHDSHTHVIAGGLEMTQCTLHDLTSVDAILEMVKTCAANTSNGWVLGSGWLLSLFPPEGKPDRKLLDEIVPDIPVYLVGIDGHSAWANSLALKLAGINRDTPDPKGGIIERDPDTGEAVGTLREFAMTLFDGLIPTSTHADYVQAGSFAIGLHNSFGITSMIDASVGKAQLNAYAELDKNNALNARLLTSIEYGTSFSSSTQDVDALVRQWKDYRGNRLKTRSIKLFVDGVLEGETAALLEPYLGKRQHHGIMNFEKDALDEIVTRFDADGFQVHMHAIGDAAVRAGLDAVEAAISQNGRRDNRHHISHLQLIDPTDIARFKQLDVIANFQALWAIPDDYIMKLNLPVVGQQRVDRMYPIGSMHASGAVIVGGSDWTVSSLIPLDAIQVGVTRSDPSGVARGVLNPAERVDLATMIKAYTINGAYLMHQEQETGSIEVGKYADLVVLDRNLFEIPAETISAARVLYTFLGGETVYSADSP